MADSQRAPRRFARVVAIAAAGAMAFTVFAGSAGSAGAAGGAPHKGGGQKSGGNLAFALEAETTDYCLSRAQLAISGIQVVAAVYDTLTVPNDKGVAVPYLAKSVTGSPDFQTWTIALRPGITFHDGEALDANAVKLNLDTYRGSPDGPSAAEGPLFTIYLGFINTVTVTDPMTVQVTLKQPVADFPAYLYSTGRMGIMAPKQIREGTACSTDMIGTGPFKLQSYRQNEATTVVKNSNYWQPGFPKADSIKFVPVPDGAARNNQLQGGQVDLIHQSSGLQIDNLKALGGSSIKLLTQGPGHREISHYFLISNKAPFSDQNARTAFATALNRTEINQIRNKGIFTVANSIMDKAIPGYLPNAGYPAFNLKKAQALVSQVKAANGGQFNIILGCTTDPDASAEAQLMKEQLGKAGINADIAQFDQATLINKALAGSIDVLLWRNLYGEFSDFSDADTYVWFANANKGFLTNFARYNDDAIQTLLDQGRAAATTAAAKPIYQQINKLMAQRGYLLPSWYVNWTIGYGSSVHVNLPPLPDGKGKPLFAYGRIPVLGLSKG